MIYATMGRFCENEPLTASDSGWPDHLDGCRIDDRTPDPLHHHRTQRKSLCDRRNDHRDILYFLIKKGAEKGQKILHFK